VGPEGLDPTVEVLDTTTVHFVGIRPAASVTPETRSRRFLHAGPPLAREELPGPVVGAVVGELELMPCQDAGGGGAVAGVVSPTLPVVVVQSSAGNLAFSPLNEGLGRALRFGSHDDATLARLAWLRDVVAPVFDRAAREARIELTELQGEGLRRGDECHNRTVATAAALLLRLAPVVFDVADSHAEAVAVLDWARGNPHFFVPFSIATAKAIVDAAHETTGSPIVTGLGGNGVRVGVRVSGLGTGWFTAPAPRSAPKLFDGFSAADAQPTLGDSLLIETIGLGAFALSAAPSICSYIGGTPSRLPALVAEMREVVAAESTRFLIPYEDFRGTPLGIDVSRVAATGIAPITNTGLAHRRPGVGQVGAGLTRLPVSPFAAAAAALPALVPDLAR
jgi:hypothetical protein